MNGFDGSNTPPADPIPANIHKDGACKDWVQFRHQTLKKNYFKEIEYSGSRKLDPVVHTVKNGQGPAYGSVQQWTVILNSKARHVKSGILPHLLHSVDTTLPNIPEKHNDSNSGILNSVMMCQAMTKELEIIKQKQNGLTYMKEFICKLHAAILNDRNFVNATHDGFDKQASTFESNASMSDSTQGKNDSYVRKLPKLGKVYAELRSCMKTSDEICNQWLNGNLPSSGMLVQRAISLKSSCRELKGKMLLHVRWLIEARLNNISYLVATYFDNANFTLDKIFGSNENKNFCKLFEVYNEYATRYLKSLSHDVEMHCNVGKQFMHSANSATMPNAREAYGNGILHRWNTLQSSTVYPLSVRYILDVLSSEFLRRVGHQVSFILSSCNNLQLQSYSKQAKSSSCNQGEIWADASRVEVRPVHPIKSQNKSSFFRVIKRVAGVNVPDLDMDKASEDCGVLSIWFTMQENIISNFITGLNGKTKLLRQSYNFQDPYMSDDAVSVASSGNVSSSSFARHSEVKSVTWHDSWNSDAVKSLTTHYRDFLTNAVTSSYFSTLLNEAETKKKENFLFRRDINHILMQAVMANLGHLNVMGDDIHKSLQCTSSVLLINSAVACSDNLMCEMLGRCSPSNERTSMQKQPDALLTCISQLCISSLHPLLHVMETYPSNDLISKAVLPRVEAILTAAFWWIQKKIQEFFASWSLPSLLQICLSDLREITNISLDCLRLIEPCHNYIESKRNINSAALHVATQYLHNIDTIITYMQVASGHCMKNLGTESHAVAYKIVSNMFPPQKSWIQRHTINMEEENKYVKELINMLLKNGCAAVDHMDAQSQLAAMTPIVNSVYESCLTYIARSKMKFTMQGALQLSYDFSTMINFITSDISGLSPDVQLALSSLHSVKRALHAAQLLQSSREYASDDNTMDERFRPESRVRSSMSTIQEEDAGEFDDKFWLSLRKQYVQRSRTWTSFLPCVEDKT